MKRKRWGFPRLSGLTRAGRGSRKRASRPWTSSPTPPAFRELGAHIVKVKPPKDFIEQAEAKKVFEKYAIPTKTMADCVRHVVQSSFNGKRVVIFSGGETKGTEELLEDVRGIAAGGGFGSIMGRNAFQRPRAEALKLLGDVMDIFPKSTLIGFGQARRISGGPSAVRLSGQACRASPVAASHVRGRPL